ncbi:MAG: GNAT family N-acetyltransferase [bacterium]|nr:GNAT family N-acetyltransferase [bacterium]
MHLNTARLEIRDLTMDMARQLHLNSLDEDNRRFVPDEVFETEDEARDVLQTLISCALRGESPLVCAVCLKGGDMIGYVQAVSIAGEEGLPDWEIGYHIASAHTGRGYATEALRAFLPVIARQLGVCALAGIVLRENAASCRVLEKCGFTMIFDGEGMYQGQPRALRRYLWRMQDDDQR